MNELIEQPTTPTSTDVTPSSSIKKLWPFIVGLLAGTILLIGISVYFLAQGGKENQIHPISQTQPTKEPLSKASPTISDEATEELTPCFELNEKECRARPDCDADVPPPPGGLGIPAEFQCSYRHSSVKNTTYSIPSTWKEWRYEGQLMLSLPPSWVLEGGQIFYSRDAGFKPLRAILGHEPSKGSRREQYIERFIDYPDCKEKIYQNTSVSEETINGLSVLKIVPNVDITKAGCFVTPAYVFTKGGTFYRLELSRGEGGRVDFWNDTSIMSEYYPILASIK